MPYRKLKFSPGEVYHLTNHGVGNQVVFKDNNDYSTFLEKVEFYRFLSKTSFSNFSRQSPEEKKKFLDKRKKSDSPLIEILAFQLLPNHFHMIVKEIKENGIQIFMGNLQNSHARQFNIKNKRKGPLFQSTFVGTRIKDDNQLMYTSSYVHTNIYAAFLVKKKDLWIYPWSSLPDYLGSRPQYNFLNKKIILSLFGNSSRNYRDYISRQLDFHREKTIKKNQ